MAVTTPIPNAYWVEPGRLLAGEYPGALDPAQTRATCAALVQAGLTFFLDLTQPGELLPYAAELSAAAQAYGGRVIHRQLSISDLGVPTPAHMADILRTLHTALAAGERVYVHCWGGIGRTGTVIACHLINQGLTPTQALARVQIGWQSMAKYRPWQTSPETEAQKAFVCAWSPAPARP